MRKHFKVFMACFLTLIMIISLIPINVYATNKTVGSGTCGDDLSWTLNSDGLLTISGTGVMSIDSDNVWDSYKDDIKSLVIDEGVTTIASYAFQGCSSLADVSLPDSLLHIERYAFYDCDSLTNVVLPDNLVYIGSNSFTDCDNLELITIPPSVVYISGIPSNCAICGYTNSAAYWYSIGDSSFQSLGTLSENDYGYINGIPYKMGSSYNISWVLYSDGQLFYCGIGEIADASNVGLGLPSEVIAYQDDIKKVYFTEGITSIGKYAFSISNTVGSSDIKFENLTSIVIADSVLTIKDYAFYQILSLESIEIGSGLETLGNYVFSYDTSLSTIIVVENNNYFKSVDNILFSKDGTKLYRFPHNSDTEYVIPDGTEIIGNDSFGDCTSLESITIPTSITQIEGYAFDGCTQLKDVYYNGNITEWNAINISDTNLTEATIHFKSKADISNYSIILSSNSYTYDGNAKKPTVTIVDTNGDELVNDTDYTASYSNNTNAGTATVTVTGIGNYTGSVSKTYTINAKSISNFTIKLSQTSYTYDGNECKPEITVSNDSITLTEKTDYTVSYSNNTNAGTATITITGKGNYTGTVTKTFEINAINISEFTATLSKTSYVYKGSECKPEVTVKNGSITLESGTDYAVSYSNNINVGTGTVTITGKGNYTGTSTETFSIVNKFVDVTDSSIWYYNNVYQSYDAGLMTGTDDTHFAPNKNMSRAMVVTVLYRMAGSPKVSSSSKFSDVKDGIWYTSAITWATNLGIISGYGNGKFGPEDDVTREQMAVMIRNYCQIYKKYKTTSTNDLTSFTDYKNVSSYAKTAMGWAVDKGIISGTESKKLNPKSKATRAECAKMLLVASKLKS